MWYCSCRKCCKPAKSKKIKIAVNFFGKRTISEFEWERRAFLKDVVSDAQQYAVQMGVDLEFVEPVTDSLDVDTFTTILSVLSKPTSYLMVSLQAENKPESARIKLLGTRAWCFAYWVQIINACLLRHHQVEKSLCEVSQKLRLKYLVEVAVKRLSGYFYFRPFLSNWQICSLWDFVMLYHIIVMSIFVLVLLGWPIWAVHPAKKDNGALFPSSTCRVSWKQRCVVSILLFIYCEAHYNN